MQGDYLDEFGFVALIIEQYLDLPPKPVQVSELLPDFNSLLFSSLYFMTVDFLERSGKLARVYVSARHHANAEFDRILDCSQRITKYEPLEN
jgi:hypothetical protein